MRGVLLAVLVALCWPPLVAQQRDPIIDVHMHALAADEQGPPPLGMCTPIPEYLAWDPKAPYTEAFIARFKKPPCPDPIWSPVTDDEVMNQTLAIAERRNSIGWNHGLASLGRRGKYICAKWPCQDQAERLQADR
jgi:hypothetical protein